MRLSAVVFVLGFYTFSVGAHAARGVDGHVGTSQTGEPGGVVLEDRYSPGLALTLSLVPTVGGIAAGIALMAAGSSVNGPTQLPLLGFGLLATSLLFAPSIGHLYAGNTSHAWGSFGARAGMLLGGVVLFTVFAITAWSEQTETMNAVSAAGMMVCLGATAGLAVWSIATAPRSARKANEKLRAAAQQKRLSVRLTPVAMKNARQENTLGLGLSATF